jgi:hypothetical protein
VLELASYPPFARSGNKMVWGLGLDPGMTFLKAEKKIPYFIFLNIDDAEHELINLYVLVDF